VRHHLILGLKYKENTKVPLLDRITLTERSNMMSKEFTVAFNQGKTVKAFKSNEELDSYVKGVYGQGAIIMNLETKEGREAFRKWCEKDNI